MRWLKRLQSIIMMMCSILMMPTAFAQSQYNMPEGVTPVSHSIYQLHMTIMYVCVGIGVVVFGILIYSLIKYRKSKGAVPADFHENATIEIIWTIIPFILLIAMAIPATRVLLEMDNTDDSAVTVKVTGYQWKWKYEYLDQGISFFSNLSTPIEQLQNKAPKNEWYLLEVDHPLVLPINKKIRFLVTANDVVHSWWVPDFGVKRDAIPGYIHETWAKIEKPGTYRGQCAELCGANHGFMPIVVKAVTEAEFSDWVAQQTQGKVVPAKPVVETKAQLLEKGKAAYATACAVCHQADGSGMPPAFPALKGGKIATGPVHGHINMVLHGVQGTAMQAFGEQLNDEEIAAIVTYERNSWGNDDTQKYGSSAGGIVQAADVAALRAAN